MKKSNDPAVAPADATRVFILRALTVGDFADEVGVPASEIILYLLRQGVACNRNQMLSIDVVGELARHYGYEVVKPQKEELASGEVLVDEHQGEQAKRSPVVVVVGHVDHGKTTLLDYIRKTRVALKEKGGITQHLGAYRVRMPQGDIVFLDTPGHEAFMRMRARGIKVADIAILVIAADDGIMPQTLEALNAAKAAGVPIIVALNKIDKADKNRIDQVKQQLSKYGLMLDEWGGDVICALISAKEGRGVDQLLEMIQLQADMLELKTCLTGAGAGYVLESKFEKGRGAVATVLLQRGVARVGDYFSAGVVSGKINAIVDDAGKPLKEIGPGMPAQISGFDDLSQAGDVFKIVTAAEYRALRSGKVNVSEALPSAEASIDGVVNILLRVDTDSAKDALLVAIKKLAAQEKAAVHVIFVGVGAITESDVVFASTAHALIYGFGVKADAYVQTEAKRLKVSIATFHVIYHLLDDLKAYLQKLRKPETIVKKIGEAVIRKVFDIKGDVIAGCYVKSGKITKDSKVVVLRGRNKIGEGDIRTLQRDRRSVKEVAAGYECAFIANGLSDFQIDDVIECYEEVEVAATT